MTRVGHTLIALSTGAVAIAVAPQLPLLAIGTAFGANVPDDLELPQRDGSTLFLHRTFTHWPPAYAIVALLAIFLAPQPWNGLLTGLAFGALIHLGVDAFSPHGIPLLSPFRARKGMGLYRTRSATEWRLIAPALALAAFAVALRLDVIAQALSADFHTLTAMLLHRALL
jgi:membrane-bound metal-dependent hydrolase YbcI (DUF457 family)